MDNILNDVCPLKRIRVREDDPQWITPCIRNCKNQAFRKECKSYRYFEMLLHKLIGIC